MTTESVKQAEPFKTLAQVERDQIMKALYTTSGNKTQAAKLLDITLKTLYNKLNQYKKDDGVETTAPTPTTTP